MKVGGRESVLQLLIGAVAIPYGVLLLPYVYDPAFPLGGGPLLSRLVGVVTGWVFIASGIAAWRVRRENRTGKLMVLIGFLTPFAYMTSVREPLVWTLSMIADPIPIPLMIYLLLAFPNGRLASVVDRVIFAFPLLLLVFNLLVLPTWNPAATGCPNCQPELNLLYSDSWPQLQALQPVGAWIIIGTAIATLVRLVQRWSGASKPARRVLNPILLPAFLWLAVFAARLVFQILANQTAYMAPDAAWNLMLWLFQISLLVMPITFAIGLGRARARRSRVGELIVELSDLPTAEELERALRRALGDPSLQVGTWDNERDVYVGVDGDSMDLSSLEDDRTSTFLERHHEPLGVVVHDPALLDDPGLVASVTAAARLAVENERLQQEVLDQLSEVHASRARLVETADNERRRIERNLHDGAQQRLVSLSLALRLAESQLEAADHPVRRSLEEASEELDQALAELRDLARGMYPAILAERGLGAAVEAMAGRSKIAIEILAMPDRELPRAVEATAYFLISEALANVTKHANAGTASVRVSDEGSQLLLEISDDGRGGAKIGAGSGLQGLQDRVAALDGRLGVKSSPGAGTLVWAEIPIPEPIPAVGDGARQSHLR